MRAAVLTAYGSPLEVVERPVPATPPDGALIRVERVGICGTDAHQWNDDWSRSGLSVALPRVLGHEVAGIVEQIGPSVAAVQVGDRVTIPFHLSCGECRSCRGGRSNICEHAEYLGASIDGGFAELLAVPRADLTCIVLPPEIDADAAASLGCRYMTAYRSVFGVTTVLPDEVVVVLGAAGGVGSALLQLLRAAHARVIAVDVADRLGDLADDMLLGAVDARADDLVSSIRSVFPEGADVVIDAHGAADALRTSFGVLRNGGRHVQVGMGPTDPVMPLNLATVKELTIHTVSGNPHSQFAGLIELVRSGVCTPAALVRRTVGLDGISEVLVDLAYHRGAGGFVLLDPSR